MKNKVTCANCGNDEFAVQSDGFYCERCGWDVENSFELNELVDRPVAEGESASIVRLLVAA